VSYKTMNNPWRPDPTPASAIAAAAAAQDAKCASGEHDEATAKQGYVTHLAGGERIEPGTRYCRRCSAILADQVAAPPAAGKE
jgi:hypothetical protein